MSLSAALTVLRTATKQIPALRYTWGLVAFSAAAAIATKLNGDGRAAVIAGYLALIGFILVVIASAASKGGPWIQMPARVLTWSVTVCFIVFLAFTISAYAASWPCNWVTFLGISSSECTQRHPNPSPQDRDDHAADYRSVEEQLALTFFQFFEARYLSNAKEILISLKSTNADQATAQRFDLIYQILNLSFVEQDISDNKEILLSRFNSNYPNDPWTSLLRAVNLYAKRDYIACAETSIPQQEQVAYPKKSTADFFKGVCYLKAARDAATDENKHRLSQQALLHFEAAQELLQKESKSYYQGVALASSIHFQGITKYYQKNIDGALQMFESAASISEGGLKARALNGMGYIYLSKGALSKAEIALTSAMDSDPSFPYAKSNYGYVLLARGDFATARNVFSENANDQRLKSESYRDVVLARLALVHLDELSGVETQKLINSYLPVLSGKKIQNYSGVVPAKFRLANIHRAIAKNIYLDKDYYGLEIFALALLTRAYIETYDMAKVQHDERLTAFLQTLSNEISSTRSAVSQDWLHGKQTGWFASISTYQDQLDKVRKIAQQDAPVDSSNATRP